MAPVQTYRNRQFSANRIPLRDYDALQLVESKIGGPVAFLNPTQAHYEHKICAPPYRDRVHSTETPVSTPNSASPADAPLSIANIEFKWTSRDNRKGRHTLVIKSLSVEHPEANVTTPRNTTHWRSILHTIWLMVTFYPVWDISWCVAYMFSLGSVLWVINSFFVFLPLIQPSSTFHNEALVGGGITAFVGATIFEIGSVFLMLEAVNENREGCFGYAVESIYEEHTGRAETGKESGLKIMPKEHTCVHHHLDRKKLVAKARGKSSTLGDEQRIAEEKSWVWFPSWTELKTHYIYELGFIASLSQFCGATIFWISGFTALPGIFDVMSRGLGDGVFWTPQVVGGTGFIVSGWLFMIETQKHWWLPAPRGLGWHIGLWNLIGGIGFTLCPAFGYDSSSWAQYQSSCSTFWGSWAFLIGSLIQLYESLEKSPVRAETST